VPYISGKDKNTILPLNTIITQIETIRNTLSEIDPQNKGIYFDNAGNYIYLLNNTQARLLDRINQYQSIPYMTVGVGLDYFIDIF
jgi:ABC-type Zn uptake system ZnuABC Zn-binding protein ZnuA